MTWLGDFHFLRPLWLLLLAALPLLWWAWRRGRDDAGAWRAAVDAHLLPHLLERGETRGGAGLWLAAALWMLLVAALAGPTWDREPATLYRNDAARVLALELAPSMLAQDVSPNRLERARYKLNDILARSADMQTALIAYAGDAFVAAPLTDDANTVRNLIDSLSPDTMPVAGNATARAIALALDLVHQAGLKRGELLILADGAGPDAIAAAREAHAHGLDISVLGIGDTTGAPVPLPGGGFLKDASGNIAVPRLDESDLRALAAAGGGRYARLSADSSDLDRLLTDRRSTGAANESAHDAPGGTRWRDRGPWLVLLALPLALVSFRRGWLMAFALVLLAPTQHAQALSFDDLWLRHDQQAARALAADDANKAAAVARTPQWRAAAAYRGGDYETAVDAYAAVGKNPDAAYNRGNALARLGRYEEALAAYEEALALAPQMPDAAANKQAVEDWLKQQNRQEQKNQQDQKQESSSQSSDAGDGEPQPADDQSGKPPDAAKDSSGKDGSGEQGEPQTGSKDEGGAETSGDASQDKPTDPKTGDTKSQSQSGDDAVEELPQSADANAANTRPSDAQQQALSRALDQALAKSRGTDARKENAGENDAKQPVRAASAAEIARNEEQRALEQWLERVPDDPGGLLRRKFLLEYQQRQQQGGDRE